MLYLNRSRAARSDIGEPYKHPDMSDVNGLLCESSHQS